MRGSCHGCRAMPAALHPSVSRAPRQACSRPARGRDPCPKVQCCVSHPRVPGKTTTLVARAAWLVDGGADPGSICIVALQQARGRGADFTAGRCAGNPWPCGRLREGPGRSTPSAARSSAMRASRWWSRWWTGTPCCVTCCPGISRADRGRLDLAFSRTQAGYRVATGDEVAQEPGARAGRPSVRRLRGRRPGVGRPRLRRSAGARRRRACAGRLPGCSSCAGAPARRGMLVDAAQDLDRAQLELGLLLAAPANDVFLVGDDDQTVYSVAWPTWLAGTAGAGRLAAGPAPGGSRDQLPVPATGRGPAP